MSSNQIYYIGRRRTSAWKDFGTIGANQQVATFTNPASHSQRLILYRAGAWAGKSSGSPVGRVGLQYTAPDSGQPGGLRPGGVATYSNEFTPTVNMTGANEGGYCEASLSDPFVTEAGYNYTTVVTNRSGTMGVAMMVAGDITETNERFYRKNISGSIPVDSVSSSVSTEGQLIAWFEGEVAVPPNQPGVITITSGGTTQTPTFRASFSDPNETLKDGRAYDRLESYRMEVWWGGTRRANNVYTATTTERNGRYSQRQTPVSIPWDTPYTVFILHRDRIGLESVSRRYDGIIHSGASVDTPTSPSGFTTTPANPGGITAVYRSSGSVSANAVQVRLVNSGGSPLQTSDTLTRTVSPNASTTVTWAQSGFGTQPNGVTRGVQMRARDTNGNWSAWSGTVWFQTNAAPNTPAPHSPGDNFISSALHYLDAAVTDPDHPQSALTVTARLYESNGTTLIGTIPVPPHSTTANRFRVIPSSLITGHKTFQWQMRAYDGFLYSDWSPLRTYIYAAVPSVTITAPTSPIETTQPTITWSSTNQTHWRVRGYDGDRLVYDTGEQAGGLQNHTVVSSLYWQGGERWNNEESFDWVVSVRDASTLWGDSAPLTLTLEYAPIETLIIDGWSEALPGIDAGTHYNVIHNSVSTYPEGQFKGYYRRRVAITGYQGSEIPGTEVVLPMEQSAGTTDFHDYHVVSNQWYRYYMWQEIEVGNDIVPSEEISIDLMASWHGVVLFSNANPIQSAVWLQYGGPDGSYEPHVSEALVRRNIAVRGRRPSIAVVSGHRELNTSGEHTFITTEGQTAQEQLDRLYRIADWQYKHLAPNGRPNSICWRSGRGGSRGLAYVTMNIDANPFHLTEVVSLDFEETDFEPYVEVE